MPHKDPRAAARFAAERYTKNKEALKARRRERWRTLEAEEPRRTEIREQNCARNKLYRDKNRERVRRRIRLHGRKNMPLPTRPCPDVCECCGRAERNRALALDHCHETNTFRGWLCGTCNSAIGILGDSVEGLKRALAYLERAKQNV